MPRGIFSGKLAIFAFLLGTVGVSAAAIAAGIAERGNRVYDVDAVQQAIRKIAGEASCVTHVEPGRYGRGLADVTRMTLRYCHRGQSLGAGTDCSAAR